MSKRYKRMLSRGAQFSLGAFELAKTDAAIEWFEPYNTDVILGAGCSDFGALEDELSRGSGFGVVFDPEQDPTSVFKTMLSTPASLLSYRAQTRGYVTTHVSACVSGLDAINDGARRIIDGYAHTVITGGVDTYVSKIILQSFCTAKAVAFDNGTNAEEIVKPFDRERTQSVLGEGGLYFDPGGKGAGKKQKRPHIL